MHGRDVEIWRSDALRRPRPGVPGYVDGNTLGTRERLARAMHAHLNEPGLLASREPDATALRSLHAGLGKLQSRITTSDGAEAIRQARSAYPGRPRVEQIDRLADERARRRYLMHVYGYTEPDARSVGFRDLRTALCLTAEHCLAPYLAGVDQALDVRPGDLPTALSIACFALWDWAGNVEPVVARFLALALRITAPDAPGPVPAADLARHAVAFPPFVALYHSVLRRFVPDDERTIAVATALARQTAIRLRDVGPGRQHRRNLAAPCIATLLEIAPEWSWTADQTPEEAFTRGVAPLLMGVVCGTHAVGDALATVTALGDALLQVVPHDG